MHNIRWFRAVALSCLLAAGCATGPAIRVDRDPSVDLSAYKTFAYFDAVDTDRAQYSTLATNRLKQATRTQMERLGYRYEERDPDVRVNFYLNVTDKQEIRSSPATVGFYSYRAGFYSPWAGYPYDIHTVRYREGTLCVDLVDAERKMLVWQGVAEGRVSDEARKNPGPAIEAVIAQIFAKFPSPPAS